MVEKFLEQTTFTSQEDFIKNLKIKIPENFNFGYDIVDAWAAEEPDKKALLWTNDKGEHIQYTYADLKKYTDMTASYFQSLGIGHGDMVMLILKRRYEFWYSIIALHKLGAVVIPATHLLTKKDIVYRCNAADIKMIVAAGEDVITKHIIDAMPDCPSVKKLVSVGPDIPEGFEDFHKGIEKAAPFVKPEHPNTNEDTSLMYFTSGTTGEPKMVAHDFTYPLGHIVTASFWHNLHRDSLHLTIADTGWGKAVWGKLYGQMIAGANIFVYDHEKFTPADILGKKPLGLFKEYYRASELTEDAWHDGIYYTGDVAWRDEDGYFWFVGRADDVIKSSGYRIGPFEVESALMTHPAVVECAITGVPDEIRGQVVKATIVLSKTFKGKEGPELVKELQDHVKRVTAPYKYPRVIEFVEELPKTISGKIRRVEIREKDK